MERPCVPTQLSSLPCLRRPNAYSRAELQRLPLAMRLSFVSPPPLRTMRSPKLLADAAFCSFNIYPTTETHVRLHRVLHTAANRGALPAHMADHAFDHRVHAIGFTPELFEFLATVTFDELDTAIIDFLVLLHHQMLCDADHAGVDSMHRELVPSVWRRVRDQIGVFPLGEPTSGRRSVVLEHLVQISFMTPWRVDVLAIYTPSASAPNPAPSPNGPNAHLPSSQLLTKLLHDWILFDSLLKPINVSPHEVVEALERAITACKSPSILSCTLAMLQSHLVVQLPTDVLERLVAWHVRRSCERLQPHQRRLPSLRKLLALSSQRLREVSSSVPASFSELLLLDDDDDVNALDDIVVAPDGQPAVYPLDVLPWKRHVATHRA